MPSILVDQVMRLEATSHDQIPISPVSSAIGNSSGWEKNGCRSEEHTSELQSRVDLVCRLLLEKKNPNESGIGLGPIRQLHPRKPWLALEGQCFSSSRLRRGSRAFTTLQQHLENTYYADRGVTS